MSFLKTYIISLLSNYSLKRFLTLFFICFVGMAFVSTSFISCSPGFDSPGSEDDDDDDDDGDDDDDDDEEDDDRDDGETCKGNDKCEWICEQIYEKYAEKERCVDEGDKKVERLKKIHDLLIAPGETRIAKTLLRDLEKISEADEEDDSDTAIRVVDLRYYLGIGKTKYIEAINNDLEGSGHELLSTTLKWITDNEEVAEAIAKADKRERVLEALLLQISTYETACMSGEGAVSAAGGEDEQINLWGLSDKIITVAYFAGGTGGTYSITFNNSEKVEVYDALSCLNSALGNRTVFSYATRKSNSAVFDMAFEILEEVCKDVETINDRPIACAKTMMCWTAWMEANISKTVGGSRPNPPSSARSDFWDMAEEHEGELEKDGGSDYNDCTAGAFSDFF